MSTVAIHIAPTPDGWGVFMTNGQQLARYRGIGSKARAIRFLRRYTQGSWFGWRRPS